MRRRDFLCLPVVSVAAVAVPGCVSPVLPSWDAGARRVVDPSLFPVDSRVEVMRRADWLRKNMGMAQQLMEESGAPNFMSCVSGTGDVKPSDLEGLFGK